MAIVSAVTILAGFANTYGPKVLTGGVAAWLIR
jgi:rhodanese-related sulfurtransferase